MTTPATCKVSLSCNGDVTDTDEESLASIWFKLMFVVVIVPVVVMLPEVIVPDTPIAPSMLSVPESSARKVPANIRSSLMVIAVESPEDISFTSSTFTLNVPEDHPVPVLQLSQMKQ